MVYPNSYWFIRSRSSQLVTRALLFYLSYCIYDLMHKSTLITYFIMSMLKKHSIKNDQKLSLWSPIIPTPVSIFFNKYLYLYYKIVGLLKTCPKKFLTIIHHNKICDDAYTAIRREKNSQNQHYWHVTSRKLLKMFSNQILLDSNVTHLLYFLFQEMCIIREC